MYTTPLFEIWRLGARSRALLDTALDGSPLTASDFGLYSLIRYRQPLTSTAISRASGMPPTTVSQHLRRLEERGHLTRSPDPRDRRASLVALSEAGASAHEGCGPVFRRALAQVEHRLGEDVARVNQVLQRLGDAVQGAIDEPVEGLPERLPGRPSGAGPTTMEYSGDPLTPDEEDEVRAFVAWLRWRRGQHDGQQSA